MKQLLIIGTVWPEPNSTAAGTRMLQLLSLFQEFSYQITFSSSAAFSDYSFDLGTMNVATESIALNNASFDEFVMALNPQIVIFDRFITEEQFGWRISEHCPDALKILDTEDLHFLRKQREIAFKANLPVDSGSSLSDIFKREIASILRCDLSLIISDFEYNLLIDQYKISPEILHYIPIFADQFKGEQLGFENRENFMHIGNFLHEPNWQSVLKLKQLWKNIRQKLPHAELHIYGSYVTGKARQLHNKNEGFIIKGRAESSEDVFLQYRVLLAPIPFGAGVKGKLLESMQYGLPNVTTEIGAEGMHHDGMWNGYISDNENDFIAKSVTLYSDPEVWTVSQQNGYQLLLKKFDRQLFEGDLAERITFISQTLNSHRNLNFLGQILQHHSLQSTKYLSKWIEEKNREK